MMCDSLEVSPDSLTMLNRSSPPSIEPRRNSDPLSKLHRIAWPFRSAPLILSYPAHRLTVKTSIARILWRREERPIGARPIVVFLLRLDFNSRDVAGSIDFHIGHLQRIIFCDQHLQSGARRVGWAG